MTDRYPLLEAAWNKVIADGARIMFRAFPGSVAGCFDANERADGKNFPTIHIRRSHPVSQLTLTRERSEHAPADLPPLDHEWELITLAHEYGHYVSWKGRTARDQWDKLHDASVRRDQIQDEAAKSDDPVATTRKALWEGLTDDDRRRIIAEEELAWDIGRELLVAVGLDDFSTFDRRREREVHYHRYHLGMEDRWDGDK